MDDGFRMVGLPVGKPETLFVSSIRKQTQYLVRRCREHQFVGLDDSVGTLDADTIRFSRHSKYGLSGFHSQIVTGLPDDLLDITVDPAIETNPAGADGALKQRRNCQPGREFINLSVGDRVAIHQQHP